MTNYIEEMMMTAGVEPNITYFEKVNSLAEISSGKSVTKERIFTIEKQLEIIKLMVQTKDFECYKSEPTEKYVAICGNNSSAHKDFPQALAQLTTELVNAGELDKEKVKEILEG